MDEKWKGPPETIRDIVEEREKERQRDRYQTINLMYCHAYKLEVLLHT